MVHKFYLSKAVIQNNNPQMALRPAVQFLHLRNATPGFYSWYSLKTKSLPVVIQIHFLIMFMT